MSTIARATIKSYDATTHSATVQIAGSLAVWLDGVPVSDGIAPADVVAGRECGVIFFTDDNPADAAIVTIHNAVPVGWPGTGGAVQHIIEDADANTYVDTEQSANEDKVRVAVGGTLRYLVQTASPHHTLTGNAQISGVAAVGPTALEGTTGFRVNINQPSGIYGLIVDAGTVVTSGQSAFNVTGVAGNAAGTDNAGVASVIGLQYLAALANLTNTMTVAQLTGVSITLLIANSAGATVSNAAFFKAAYSTLAPAAITTMTGLSLPASGSTKFGTVYHIKGGSISGAGVVYVPFEFAGPARTTDTDGSAHRNNIQFGSVTRKFGGGDGVIGLTYATTNPTANPAGGVVIYADAATGDFKVRGAAGQICKLPSGGATNVTGSRGGNAALANLLTVLAGLGLIVDGTTA
jgi:hypothetical protein